MTLRRAGYSLLEVLVAFAVLMTVLAAVLPGKTASLQRVSEAKATFLAQDFALSRLDRFAVAEWPSDPAPMDLTEEHAGWTVRILAAEIQPFTAPEGLASQAAYRLSVQVLDAKTNALLAEAHRHLPAPVVP